MRDLGASTESPEMAVVVVLVWDIQVEAFGGLGLCVCVRDVNDIGISVSPRPDIKI